MRSRVIMLQYAPRRVDDAPSTGRDSVDSHPDHMPSPSRAVAFLRLGAIGRPMAARLAHADGVSLGVWNRTALTADGFASEHGVRAARTPAEAARGAEVIITCFP